MFVARHGESEEELEDDEGRIEPECIRRWGRILDRWIGSEKIGKSSGKKARRTSRTCPHILSKKGWISATELGYTI